MLYTNICTIFYLTYPHHEQMYVSNICLYAPTKKKRQTLVCLFYSSNILPYFRRSIKDNKAINEKIKVIII